MLDESANHTRKLSEAAPTAGQVSSTSSTSWQVLVILVNQVQHACVAKQLGFCSGGKICIKVYI